MADYEARGLTGRPVLWRIARRQIAADLDRFIEVDRRLRAAANFVRWPSSSASGSTAIRRR
jgi:hypothetical protein